MKNIIRKLWKYNQKTYSKFKNNKKKFEIGILRKKIKKQRLESVQFSIKYLMRLVLIQMLYLFVHLLISIFII